MKKKEQDNLCQITNDLGVTCIGCCGHHFKQKDIEQDIKNNELQFLQALEKHGVTDFYKITPTKKTILFDELKKDAKYLRDSGVCRFLINLEILKDIKTTKTRLGCPLHVSQNKDKDYRAGYCDLDYECKTFFYYKNLSDIDKERFIKFLSSKLKKEKLTNITFSIKMDDNSLLDEFQLFRP